MPCIKRVSPAVISAMHWRRSTGPPRQGSVLCATWRHHHRRSHSFYGSTDYGPNDTLPMLWKRYSFFGCEVLIFSFRVNVTVEIYISDISNSPVLIFALFKEGFPKGVGSYQ